MQVVHQKSVVEFILHAQMEGKPLHAVSLLAAITFPPSMDWPEPVLCLSVLVSPLPVNINVLTVVLLLLQK